MMQKYARFLLTVLLVMAFCPAAAFANDETAGESGGNPFDSFISAVTGFASGTTDKSQALYSSELAVPPLTNTLPGFEGAEPLPNGGILLGGGDGYVFYLREAAFKGAGSSITAAYRTLECYSSADNTWSTLASLPTYLEFCSAAIWNEKIYLTGAPMAESGGIPQHSTASSSVIYTFDVSEGAGIDNQWESADGVDIPVATSLVNSDGRLEMVGGLRNGAPSSIIAAYDSDSGTLETVGQMNTPVAGASTVTNDRVLYIYTCGNSLGDLRAGTGTPQVLTYSTTEGEQGMGSFPSFTEPSDMSVYPSQRAVISGTLSSADSGVLFVGPTSESSGTDTYRMNWGGDSFAPFNQTLSAKQLCGAASDVYLNNLYGVAGVLDESGQPAMVFRSTPMPNASILSGNNGVWRKGSTNTLDFRFSPNFGRFSNYVEVDGDTIAVGSDYEAAPGSTVVQLTPDYLESLEVGEYLLTTYYDNRLTTITARFIIEEAPSYIPGGSDGNGGDGGYTQPTALAPTFDPLPVLPIAVLAVVAAVLAIVALRRHSSS